MGTAKNYSSRARAAAIGTVARYATVCPRQTGFDPDRARGLLRPLVPGRSAWFVILLVYKERPTYDKLHPGVVP